MLTIICGDTYVLGGGYAKCASSLMNLTEADNQSFFDERKYREKACASWLKEQSTVVHKPVLLAAIAGIINGLAVIAQSALLAYILQALIIDKLHWLVLIPYFLWLAGVFILRSVCVYYHQTYGFEAGAKVRAVVRQQLIDKISSLGPAAIKQRQSGELVAITLEQVDALENYFSRYLAQHTIVGVLPIIMIAVVMPINWVVGLIFLFTGPLVPVFMALVGMGAASANRNQFLAMTRMSGYFLDRMQGLATLKLFGQAYHELANINHIADGFREKTMSVLRIAFLSSAILEFFSAVAVALVAMYVGLGLLGQIHFGPAQQISLSEALFVLLLAPEFFMPLRQLAVYYHDKAAALGAADAILAILEQDSEVFNGIGGASNAKDTFDASIIEFREASKYYGQRQVLTNINLKISVGEKIALVGESGAGKTTLLNLLLGFEAVSEGLVLLEGQLVTRDQAVQVIASAGQQTYIFHGSIRDNIALSNPEASEQSIFNAATSAGVTEFSTQLAEGLHTLIGERGYGLSGGQIQRIALARAFLKEAEIIVLDEPTANLDTANKIVLLDIIDELFKGKTLIIASHDHEVIKRMDRKVEIQQGRLVS
ncbi:MAG: thiol reductant ABC exporter subunit CydD [Methylococcales bacterium]|nr:MAG: thiol reductant ABC exporter subunit CydD [Methylococcales bacterium]